MGTNFYMMTKSKETRDKHFGWNYELTDTPDWGYKIHIAKTSMGWLPLFQAHECFRSIKQLKKLYDTGEFILADEYGTTYNWEEFDKRVLQHNGGIRGVAPREEIKMDPNSRFYDHRMPKYRPVSHFDYKYDDPYYSMDYFTDESGYEFTNHEFS